MLEKIKSKYILKIVIMNLCDKAKFKLIMVNKKMFNKLNLNLNLLDYKIVSGKYFIGQKNGMGKEYSSIDNALLYEGEYIDGKKCGYGKEYNLLGKLIFDGKYINGKKNGRGKEYFNDGKIKFEGIYFFGTKYNGKGYDKTNKLIYEIKDGNGYIYELDNFGYLIYEGEYLNGKKNGKGKEYYYKDKIKFQGIYLNDIKMNGIGYDINNEAIYEIKEGKGHIKEYDYFGNLQYEGEYLYGEINGYVKEYNNHTIIYEGDYANGKRSGNGKEYNKKSKELIYEGEYFHGFKRKGRLYINNKLEFEGEFLFNKKWSGKGYDNKGNIIYEVINGNGNVKEYFNNGKINFIGEMKDGKKLKGVEYRFNGKKKFEGEYKDEKEFKGISFDKKGKKIFEGEYLNGKKFKGKEYNKDEIIFEGNYINGKRWNGKIKTNFNDNSKFEGEY